MARVVHFDISADKPEELRKFYESVFGWKFDKWEGPMEYWLIRTGEEEGEPGIDGAIMGREDDWTTINTISVPSLDEYRQKVEKAGGKVVSPKQTVPGVGYHCYCLDTEGNVFGILEEDLSAQ